MDQLILDSLAAVDFAGLLSKAGSILSVIVGLGLVIFFHEFGHFIVAKWCNVHVDRFSIGFGPILWSRQKGETEYALSAFPFGGYVKMLGQDDMDPNQMTSSEIAENPRSFSAKSVPQRMAIISAGVIMNIITAFMFFVICAWFGFFEPAPVVGSVTPGFPAWHAGVQPGDRITTLNGSPLRSFGDLQEGIMLSSGEVTLGGTRLDGSPLLVTMTPQKFSPGLSIGAETAMTTRMVAQIPDPALISDAGLPVDSASQPFEPGDHIVGMRALPAETSTDATSVDAATSNEAVAPIGEMTEEVEIKSFGQLRTISAKYSDRTLAYTVERTMTPATAEQPAVTKSVEITVPPGKVRSIGLWMAMGPVGVVRKGSIAEQAGLQVGDTIVRVDDKEPGRNFDPLQLPVYFGQQAGKTVTVVVNRAASAAKGDEEVTLTMTPTDIPGWLEGPDFQTTPLTIPAIGAGYQVQPRIARVLPGSEAERSGKFRPDMKITRIALIHAEPGAGKPDAWGDDTKGHELNLAELKEGHPGTVDQINWAWAFAQIQRVPLRHIQVYFDDGKTTGSQLLKTTEHADDWWLWFRGFNGSIWQPDREFQQATSFGDALSMGAWQTRKSAVSIYLTLKSLVQRKIDAKALSGPLGIAQVGYLVAERGVIHLVKFLGFLSINLAIMNFLPIPVLDGGHMVFLIWEGVTRRKPNPRVVNWAMLCGLAFIIGLFLFVTKNDLVNLF